MPLRQSPAPLKAPGRSQRTARERKALRSARLRRRSDASNLGTEALKELNQRCAALKLDFVDRHGNALLSPWSRQAGRLPAHRMRLPRSPANLVTRWLARRYRVGKLPSNHLPDLTGLCWASILVSVHVRLSLTFPQSCPKMLI